MKKLLATLVFFSVWAGQAFGLCQGTTYNPMYHLNWEYVSVTIAGVPVYKSFPDPAEMYEPPVCYCPSATLWGYPVIGMGISYWEPLYVSEVTRHPGCLMSLGPTSILQNYKMLEHSHNDSVSHFGADASHTQRSQIHFYQWPGYAVMDLFQSFECSNSDGVDLMWMTEVDPFWQSPEWGKMLAMETALFANVAAQYLALVDAVACEFGECIPFFIHVMGPVSLYPFDGNSQGTNSSYQANRQLSSKFIARQARLGLMWTSIGPGAYCGSYPSPFIMKNQYRPDPFFPVKTQGLPINMGASGKTLYPPATNWPTSEDQADTIWVGKQCCLKSVP